MNTPLEKKFAEAAIEYRNAVQAVPQDGDVRIKLADALWDAGEFGKSAAEYVRAADLLETRDDVQVKAGKPAAVRRQVRRREGACREGAEGET